MSPTICLAVQDGMKPFAPREQSASFYSHTRWPIDSLGASEGCSAHLVVVLAYWAVLEVLAEPPSASEIVVEVSHQDSHPCHSPYPYPSVAVVDRVSVRLAFGVEDAGTVAVAPYFSIEPVVIDSGSSSFAGLVAIAQLALVPGLAVAPGSGSRFVRLVVAFLWFA